MNIIESLKQANDKEGWGLEERTSKIFEDMRLITKCNFPLTNGINIDVFSYPHPENQTVNSIFVVECKGSSPNNYLSLIDESKQVIDERPNTDPFGRVPRHRLMDVLVYEKNDGLKYYSPNGITENLVIICEENVPEYFTFRYCYTGDFRAGQPPHKKNKQNSLYKVILQLLRRLDLLRTKISEITSYNEYNRQLVVPIIVTNAKIFILNHDQPIEVPWAIYDCKRITSLDDNPLSIKYVFVVNINNLAAFIKKIW